MIFNKYKAIHQNPEGRLFAVGDLHGCLDQLISLLELIRFKPEVDQIIFVGDLADRGNQNLESFNFVLDKPYFHVVAGNHEHLLFEHVHGRQALPQDILDYWISDDGAWSKAVSEDALLSIAKKLNHQCHIMIEAQTADGTRFGLTHAGYDTAQWYNSEVDYQDDYFGRMMWSRKTAESLEQNIKPVEGIDYTVHGHTIFEDALLKGNAVFIDTGCVVGGKLTALNLTQFSKTKTLDPSTVFTVQSHND